MSLQRAGFHFSFPGSLIPHPRGPSSLLLVAAALALALALAPPGLDLLRAGTHHYSHDFGIRCMAFEQSLFRHNFGTFIFRILVPTWPQLGPQLGPKINQKSIQEPSKIDPKSHLIFDRFFDRCLIDFWSIFELKIDPKSFQNRS